MKTYKLVNYTSGYSTQKSILAIENLLISAGAKQISKFYNDSMVIEGIIFQMSISQGVNPIFKLPSKVKNVEKLMKANTQKQKEQAERTAWKLLHDWVALQVAMIKLEQIQPVEAFIAYAYDRVEKKTHWELVNENKIKLLN